MKYFKIHEQFQNENELKYWAYEYAKTNYDGLNSYEDAVEELDIFFEQEYQYLQGDFILYRVLQVESQNDIKQDKLGIHYIHPSYLERIYERGWYDSIGVSLNDYEDLFLVEVITNYNMVNWSDTIHNRLNFPREFEITLKDTPTITNITKIDESKIE